MGFSVFQYVSIAFCPVTGYTEKSSLPSSRLSLPSPLRYLSHIGLHWAFSSPCLIVTSLSASLHMRDTPVLLSSLWPFSGLASPSPRMPFTACQMYLTRAEQRRRPPPLNCWKHSFLCSQFLCCWPSLLQGSFQKTSCTTAPLALFCEAALQLLGL